MHKQIFVKNKLILIIFLSMILFSIVIGNQINENINWKHTTSENQYHDLSIKTESKIKSGTNILNYFVNFTSNIPNIYQFEYYPIHEVNGIEKQTEYKKTKILNKNHTANFEILLDKGKNTWSIGIDFLNSPDDKITHTGKFDEVNYDE